MCAAGMIPRSTGALASLEFSKRWLRQNAPDPVTGKLQARGPRRVSVCVPLGTGWRAGVIGKGTCYCCSYRACFRRRLATTVRGEAMPKCLLRGLIAGEPCVSGWRGQRRVREPGLRALPGHQGGCHGELQGRRTSSIAAPPGLWCLVWRRAADAGRRVASGPLCTCLVVTQYGKETPTQHRARSVSMV
jgi:hypothetical protein